MEDDFRKFQLTEVLMNYPNLSQKIDLLLLHHETIRTKGKLANYLGIAQSNISVWINGDSTGNNKREKIPLIHLKKFCDLFGIDEKWLRLDDLAKFETYFLQRVKSVSKWHQLIAHRDSGNAIKLIPCPSEDDPPKLSYEDELESLADRYFPQSQKVFIEINLNKVQQRIEFFPQTLTLIDVGSRYKSLCPSKYFDAPDSLIKKSGKILVPRKAPNKFLTVDDVGYHYLAAIFTDLPLSPQLTAALSDPDAIDIKPALDAFANSLLNGPQQSWRVLYWNYHVYVGNQRFPN